MTLTYENGEQHVILNEQDVSDAIRTPDISLQASHVAAIPAVRDFLLSFQRDLANTRSVIMDGRDIGTVVLPDAQVKIFLTASAPERARRRYLELCEKGGAPDMKKLIAEIERRDEQDRSRKTAPLRQASDAVLLDTTNLDFDAVCDQVTALVHAAQENA